MKKAGFDRSFVFRTKFRFIFTAAVFLAICCLLTTILYAAASQPAASAPYSIPLQPDSNDPDWQTVSMRVTAYCPCKKCCGEDAAGITASGHHIQDADMFVAAPRNYPFNTEFRIPGYNQGSAVKTLDRGGAIHDNRLDVFFPTHKQALQWGVKQLDVKVRIR